jgi:hypothetical protein
MTTAGLLHGHPPGCARPGPHRLTLDRDRRSHRRCRAAASLDPSAGSDAGVGARRAESQPAAGLSPARSSRSSRGAAREQLKQEAAEGPDVGAAVDRAAARLLGRHVGRRAENHADSSHGSRAGDRGGVGRAESRRLSEGTGLSRSQRLGQPEIQHLDHAVAADFDVRRLQCDGRCRRSGPHRAPPPPGAR